MWFTFVTARLFIFLSFHPRLAATLLRSCSVVNSPTRRVGLAPTFKPASLAQALRPPVKMFTADQRFPDHDPASEPAKLSHKRAHSPKFPRAKKPHQQA